MKIYISGSISGQNIEETMLLFLKAEKLIRDMGHEPINPLDNDLPEGTTWFEYIVTGLMVLSTCQAIMMLPTWEKSNGAKLELANAKNNGKILLFLSENMKTFLIHENE
jgi:p-aminobenzoyl-glutamate transporter AbgT